jgi:hypothetical protein
LMDDVLFNQSLYPEDEWEQQGPSYVLIL